MIKAHNTFLLQTTKNVKKSVCKHKCNMQHAPNFRDKEKIYVIRNCQWNTLTIRRS